VANAVRLANVKQTMLYAISWCNNVIFLSKLSDIVAIDPNDYRYKISSLMIIPMKLGA
jgi:hypothetical protein